MGAVFHMTKPKEEKEMLRKCEKGESKLQFEEHIQLSDCLKVCGYANNEDIRSE